MGLPLDSYCGTRGKILLPTSILTYIFFNMKKLNAKTYYIAMWTLPEKCSPYRYWKDFYFYIYDPVTLEMYSINSEKGLRIECVRIMNLKKFKSSLHSTDGGCFLIKVQVEDITDINIPYLQTIVEPEIYL